MRNSEEISGLPCGRSRVMLWNLRMLIAISDESLCFSFPGKSLLVRRLDRWRI